MLVIVAFGGIAVGSVALDCVALVGALALAVTIAGGMEAVADEIFVCVVLVDAFVP